MRPSRIRSQRIRSAEEQVQTTLRAHPGGWSRWERRRRGGGRGVTAKRGGASGARAFLRQMCGLSQSEPGPEPEARPSRRRQNASKRRFPHGSETSTPHPTATNRKSDAESIPPADARAAARIVTCTSRREDGRIGGKCAVCRTSPHVGRDGRGSPSETRPAKRQVAGLAHRDASVPAGRTRARRPERTTPRCDKPKICCASATCGRRERAGEAATEPTKPQRARTRGRRRA